MAAGVNVYYNSTGQTKCYSITQTATSKLGTRGWDYQVWECGLELFSIVTYMHGVMIYYVIE